MLKAVITYSKTPDYTVHKVCYYDGGIWVEHKCNFAFANRKDMIDEIVKIIPSNISLKPGKIIKELLFIHMMFTDFEQFYY